MTKSTTTDLPGYDSWKIREPDVEPIDPTITRCPVCDEPVHSSESDDEGRCEECSARFYRDELDASKETARDVSDDYRASRSGR